MTTTQQGRAWLTRTALGVFLAGLFLISGDMAAVSAQEATPGIIGTAVATECTTDLGTSEVPDGATGYTVDGETSEARYTVEEELARQGTNEAIGTTNAVIGTILIDADGTPLPCSRFDVDLRTLQTDEAKRDARVQEALETGTYPVATFIVTDVQLASDLKEDEPTDVTLVGNLDLHGVSQQVIWTGSVTKAGDSLSGTATTTVSFDAYGITKPVIGPVMSIADTLTLEVDLVANAA